MKLLDDAGRLELAIAIVHAKRKRHRILSQAKVPHPALFKPLRFKRMPRCTIGSIAIPVNTHHTFFFQGLAETLILAFYSISIKRLSYIFVTISLEIHTFNWRANSMTAPNICADC